MVRYIRLIAGVALLLPVSGCDTLHAPIYNLTPCPIEVTTSISKFPHSLGSAARIFPGHSSGVLGGSESVRYDEIIIRDARNAERRYDESALTALRPTGVSDDQWAYSDSGLSFLNQEPSQDNLNQIATQPCREAGH